MSDTPAGGPPPLELLRVTLVGDDELHIQLGPIDLFDDPGVWGEVMANAAAQIAEQIQKEGGPAAETTIRAISETFGREITNASGAGE